MIMDDCGRQVMHEWLDQRIKADAQLAPDMLWHYTGADGLMGILESDCLWATEARSLNDSSELSYGAERGRKALEEFNTSGFKDVTRRFIEGLADQKKNILSEYFEAHLKVFVACFCAKKDLLSQWRAYGSGDSADTYAIGFRPPGAVAKWAMSAPEPHLSMRRVLYDPREQQAACHELIEGMVNFLDVDPESIERQNSFARYLSEGLAEAAAWCKHPAFEEESEWRMIYAPPPGHDALSLKHRSKRGHILPYVQLRVPAGVGALHDKLPVAEIVCGPSSDPILKHRGVESLIKALDRKGTICIDGTSAPLRL